MASSFNIPHTYVIIFEPMAISMSYDSIPGVFICIISAAMGFKCYL